jgi:hypothetical protein
MKCCTRYNAFVLFPAPLFISCGSWRVLPPDKGAVHMLRGIVEVLLVNSHTEYRSLFEDKIVINIRMKESAEDIASLWLFFSD